MWICIEGTHGCGGGFPSDALKYVQAYGITSQGQYPYVERDQACQLQGGSFRISSLLGFVGCQGLLAGINDKPVSFMVDASNCGSYSSGVFGNCETGINHAVLLVGLEWMVWKIKNSWGGGWGKGGFIQLNGGNTCGVCQNPAILIR